MVPWVALALFLCAPASAEVLYSDPAEGSYIVRDAAVAEAFRDSDLLCDAYQDARRRLEGLPAPRRASDRRERAYRGVRAAEALGECLSADRRAVRVLARVIGQAAAERLLKAEAFEDTVYAQTEPEDAPPSIDVASR